MALKVLPWHGLLPKTVYREGKMLDVLVIGCGASGMMAAISAARTGAITGILEGGEKPGKKLLLTGNSRCNLTNLDFDPDHLYLSEDEEWRKKITDSVFSQFSVTDTLNFFHGIGLQTMVEHRSYVYPSTGQSRSVLKLLLLELRRLHVEIHFQEKVLSLRRRTSPQHGGIWLAETERGAFSARSVILAAGSSASPLTGSDGSGYLLARKLGLSLVEPLPSLTGIRCSLIGQKSRAVRVQAESLPRKKRKGRSRQKGAESMDLLSSLAGLRMNAKVSAFSAGRLLAEDSGQIQWTQSDLSGIVTFQVSQTVTRALSRGQDVELSLDLLPALNREELSSSLRKLSSRNLDLTVEELLLGFLPALMIPVVLSTLPESLSLRKSGSLTEADFQSISRALKALRLKALSVRGFDSCQVCAGGVSLSELNPLSLEAERSALQGLYLAGELLDLDGPCGGYNLQWAWSSGWTAGKHAGISAGSGD